MGQPGDADLVHELVSTLGPFSRFLRRVVSASFPEPAISGAQADLLRTVQRRPGIAVNAAAEWLQVAPNTVSTLAGALEAEGYLERRRSDDDRRSIGLHLTSQADELLERWGEHRARIVAAALAELDPLERHVLVGALPVIRKLQKTLEAQASR
ncbi:MarR family winged helix-turn-helix transcriptional regulator [Prauserella oleivorans]|uniref:MarR family winged helix-turn-helix transcriptional regulator n=1 Tax=Prauserella oleivorans TaxID=1478153 RepID=A0ABW5W8L0_9PSEU